MRFNIVIVLIFLLAVICPCLVFAQIPTIHLVTLNDQSDPELADYTNASVAKLTGLFLKNIPSKQQQLTLTHIVVRPINGVVANRGNPKICEELQPLTERCSESCPHQIRYVGDFVRHDVSHHIPVDKHSHRVEPCREADADALVRHIRNVVRSIPIQPHDTVVFYYNGHAKYDVGNQKLVYEFSNGVCTMDDVHDAFKTKRPDLIVFLNDCCRISDKDRGIRMAKVIPPAFAPVAFAMRYSRAMPAAMPVAEIEPCPRPQKISASFDDLFVKPSGSVFFYASKDNAEALAYAFFHNTDEVRAGSLFVYNGITYSGEEIKSLQAVKDAGSVFTEAIYRSLTEPNSIRSWEAFNQRVSENAHKVFQEIPLDKRNGLNNHTPHLDSSQLRKPR